jgi:hypothetical protein
MLAGALADFGKDQILDTLFCVWNCNISVSRVLSFYSRLCISRPPISNLSMCELGLQ